MKILFGNCFFLIFIFKGKFLYWIIERFCFGMMKWNGVGCLNFFLFLINWWVLFLIIFGVVNNKINNNIRGGKVYCRYFLLLERLMVVLKGIGLIFFDFWLILVRIRFLFFNLFDCCFNCNILSNLFLMLVKWLFIIWVVCLWEIILFNWK